MTFIHERKLIIYTLINKIQPGLIAYLPAFFLLLFSKNMQGQSIGCNQDTSFATSYYYPQEEMVFLGGTLITKDNATLMVFQSRNRATGKKAILITETDIKGIPIWSRKIEAEFANIAAMLATDKGSVFAINGFLQGSSKFLLLFCIDDNGHIKWQYKYQVSNLHLTNEFVQMQNSGDGLIDMMVSVHDATHPAHTSVDGDFFYFQMDKNGQPVTKAFIFDGGYGSYDFFSYLMGVKREVSNATTINLYLMNQMIGGWSLRSYPSFCNSIYGYSSFQLDVTTSKTSNVKYFCPGIIDTLPPNGVSALSNIEPKYSFAVAADGSAILSHRNVSRSYPEEKFITFKNDTISGILVADSLHDAPPSFALSSVGDNGKNAYLMARSRTGSSSIDFAHFGIIQNGRLVNQKIASISENAFSGNININTANNGSEYLTILSRPDDAENMPGGVSLYKLSVESNGMNVCNTSDSVVATSHNIPFTSVTLPAPTVVTENIIPIATSLIAEDEEVNFVKKCEVVSNCDSLEIIAPDSICSGAPFNVIVRKNKNCGKPVSMYGSLYVQLLQQTNDSTFIFKINQPGNNLLLARFRDCENIKTTKNVISTHDDLAPVQLPFHDTTLCSGASLIIKAPPGYQSYSWNNGFDTLQSISVNKKGWQYIEVQSYCGTHSIDSVKINYDSSFVKLSVFPKEICIGDTAIIEIKSDSLLHHYTWYSLENIQVNSQHTIMEVWPSATTSYKLGALSKYNCSVSDSAVINVFQLIPENVLNKTNFDLCKGDSFFIHPDQKFAHYLWSTGDTTSKVLIKKPGDYYVVVYDEHNCNNKSYFKVHEIICSEQIFFPSAFSPNQDGLNEVFKAIITGDEPRFFELQIFNRWGQLVYTTNNIIEGWDGNFKSSKQPVGTYVWICRYKFTSGDTKIIKGKIFLIR